MDLVIQAPGHRVVPRQRLGPIPQLFMGASPEHSAQTFLAHWEVTQKLQHVEEDRNRYRVQHNRLERVHHLEQQH